MLMSISRKVAIGLFVLTGATAFAQNRQFEINYQDKEFTGQSVLKIKQDLSRAYPRLNLDNRELERVVLVAKSRAGNAEARLRVGRFDSRIEQIDGNPQDYRAAGSFHRIPFEAPNRDNGVWQIEMRGNIKVRKVIVTLSRDVTPPRPNRVTRQCGYVLETVWGQDIRRFSASATGIAGSGVQAKACEQARKQCIAFQRDLPLSRDLPLTRCVKL